MSKGILGNREPTFRAVAEAVVPESGTLSDAEWQAGLAIVEGVVGERPAALQRQLRIFLGLLEHGARLRYGRPLSRLEPDARAAWLRTFERSRVPLLRKGFWGVRTLSLMAYYARPEGGTAVGYRASAGGWQARRSAS